MYNELIYTVFISAFSFICGALFIDSIQYTLNKIKTDKLVETSKGN